MKKILQISLLFSISILFIQCEQIDVIESDIPYTEVFVINGRLIGDSSDVSVSFTKSFRIEQDLSREDVALKDVTAYIWSESQGIYPLKHVGNGEYKPMDKLTIFPDQTYELFAKIGDERVDAKTYVPKYPEVKEIKLQAGYITCKLLPNSKTVYGVKYKIVSLYAYNQVFEEDIFYEISDTLTDTKEAVEIKTSRLPDEYFEEPKNFDVSITIYAFDENYKAYYETRKNNKPIENIFSEGGGSVYWNVHGDKSIGMFIAYTKLELTNLDL